MSKKRRSVYLLIAGILQLILSFICMFFGVIGLAATLTIIDMIIDQRIQQQLIISISALAAFALGFTGGIQTIKQTRLPLAITGILSIISWNIYSIFYSLKIIPQNSGDIIIWLAIVIFLTILACISLTFIITSRNEFERRGKKE